MNAKNIIGKILIICLILIIILFICLVIESKNQINNTSELKNETVIDEKVDETGKKIEPVKSSTAYFTVQSCVNKYISYILEKDLNSVYNILDNEYIEKNAITENNVLDKINNINEKVIFEATKMYVQEIDENNNKYYVSGVLEQDNFGYVDEKAIVEDKFNVAVVLDLENMIFSIIPLEDGGIFNEENN